MSNNAPNRDLAQELRYALDVMEEYSHLGLDDEAASRLRNILLRRIQQAEDSLSILPASAVRYPASKEKVFA